MNSYPLAWGVGGGGGRGGQGIIRWWGHIYVVNTLIKSFTSIIIAKQLPRESAREYHLDTLLLPLRFSKRQSPPPTKVLLRTSLKRTIQ